MTPAHAKMPRGMRPLLLCGLLALGLPACGSPSAPDHQGGGAVLTEAHPDRMRVKGWLEFADLSLHTDAERDEPVQPYVRGVILGGYFAPDGDIVGPLDPPSGGRVRVLLRGWLDLRTRAFHAEVAGPPPPPYVEGVKEQDSGAFFPTAAIVHEVAASR